MRCVRRGIAPAAALNAVPEPARIAAPCRERGEAAFMTSRQSAFRQYRILNGLEGTKTKKSTSHRFALSPARTSFEKKMIRGLSHFVQRKLTAGRSYVIIPTNLY